MKTLFASLSLMVLLAADAAARQPEPALELSRSTSEKTRLLLERQIEKQQNRYHRQSFLPLEKSACITDDQEKSIQEISDALPDASH